MKLKDIATTRRATKVFNAEKKVPEKELNEIFEIINSTPSSMGLDAWRVLDIRSQEIKEKIVDGFSDFNKDRFMFSSDALIFISKKEKYFTKDSTQLREKIEKNLTHIKSQFNEVPSKEEIDGTLAYIEATDHGNVLSDKVNPNREDRTYITEWSKRQAYIGAAYAMLAAKEKNIDSLPMEGFSYELTKKLSELNLIDIETEVVSIVIALGYKDETKVYELGKGQIRPDIKERFIVK